MFEMSPTERATTSKIIDVENDSLPEAIAKKTSNSSISNNTRDKLQKIIQRRLLNTELREEVVEATQLIDSIINPVAKEELNEILHPLRVTVGEESPTIFDKDKKHGATYSEKFSNFLKSPSGNRHNKEIDLGINALQKWVEKWNISGNMNQKTKEHRASAINHLYKGLLGKPRNDDDSTLRSFIEEGKIYFFKNISALYNKELSEEIVHPLLDSTISDLDVCDPGIIIALQNSAEYIDQLQGGDNIFDQFIKQREGLLTTIVSAHVRNLFDTKVLAIPTTTYNLYEKHFFAAHRWAAARELIGRLGLSPSLKELNDPYAINIINNPQAWRGIISFNDSVDNLVDKLGSELRKHSLDWNKEQVNDAFTIIQKAFFEVADNNHLDITQQEIPEDLIFSEFYEAFNNVIPALVSKGWAPEYLPKMNDMFSQQKNEQYFYKFDKTLMLASLFQQLSSRKIIDISKLMSTNFMIYDFEGKLIYFNIKKNTIDILRPEDLNEKFDHINIKKDHSLIANLIKEAELRRDPSDEEHDKMFARWRASLNQPSTSRE